MGRVAVDDAPISVRYPDRFYIGGSWSSPSSAATIDVMDSATEQAFLWVAEAREADLDRAIEAARRAFDEGAWPRLEHAERAVYLRDIAAAIRDRADILAQMWPRETGILYSSALATISALADAWDFYADLADDFPFEETMKPTVGAFGLLAREPVGVVGAIIPWNGPLSLITYKVAPALLAGCTVVLKASPEAPGEAYIMAEIFEAVGLPPGVVNVVTAHREVSELLVSDHRVDKISFTGSTAAGRRIATILGGRIGRCTLELGGKSAAVILDDMDLVEAARCLAAAGCRISGQVCSSLTRIIVSRPRHDELVDALAHFFGATRVGDPFDPLSEMGPLASEQQLRRVESMIAQGVSDGARLVVGGGRPEGLDVGYYVEPTIFADVDNASVIAQNEIFGPVLAVLPVDDEEQAVAIANDSIYGLNASVFTHDVNRARAVARRLRTGTVGHNAFRTDFGMAFGGYKQSGIGREGGREGLLPYLEVKSIILNDIPTEEGR